MCRGRCGTSTESEEADLDLLQGPTWGIRSRERREETACGALWTPTRQPKGASGCDLSQVSQDGSRMFGKVDSSAQAGWLREAYSGVRGGKRLQWL